jgi:import inner membrane translocase subunit TIM21
VEHKNYVGEDGSKRLRIRFNIEGPFGHAFVFAEVTADMPKGQWMYLLVQDMQTGRVMTLEDNRAMYEAMSKSASPEERAALQALIQSGGSQR